MLVCVGNRLPISSGEYACMDNGTYLNQRLERLILAATPSNNRQTTQLLREQIRRAGETITSSVNSGEVRSREASYHVIRVAEHSRMLALKAGLAEKEADLIRRASPLHDVGKIAIPDTVLFKPGRLNQHERAIMETHAEIGYDLLRHSDYQTLRAAATVAWEHHERWNGNGYPRGLKGTDAHLFGRINAIADVFDALLNERCYKPAWPLSDTIAYFRDQRGKQFDPVLIDALLLNVDDFLAIQKKFSKAGKKILKKKRRK